MDNLLKNVPIPEAIIIRATVWYVARQALLDYVNNHWDGKSPIGNYVDGLAKAEAELSAAVKPLIEKA